MVPRLTVLLCLIVLGGCVAPRFRPSATPAAGALSKDWLVGGWVLEGESCESDAGVVYRADGSWVAYGASGTWTIEDAKLVTRITAQGADNSAMTELKTPRRIVERVEVTGPNAFVSRRSDGSVLRLIRCPGSAE